MVSGGGSSSQRAANLLRYRIGVGFLATQAILIGHGLLSEGKHFAWAPHTTQVSYELDVEVDGRNLSEREIRRRYRLLYYPWEAHSYRNLIDLLLQYERTYGKEDHTRLVLRYSVNGHPPETWRWSDP